MLGEMHLPEFTLKERNLAWKNYWESGTLNSCPTSFVGNYSGAIENFWLDAARQMQAENRVLDIATGNGPIPKLLLNFAVSNNSNLPMIDAIDLSTPNPKWLDEVEEKFRQRINFSGDIAAEKLPFKSQSFDWVISQFGFEYAKRNAAIAELKRVKKPCGFVRLVMHHKNSIFADVARQEKLELDWLLNESFLFDRFNYLVPYLLIAQQPDGIAKLQGDANATRARQEFNAVVRELSGRSEISEVPDVLIDTQRLLGQILQMIREGNADHLQQQAEKYRQNLIMARVRVSELLSHALDHDDIQVLASALLVSPELEIAQFYPLKDENGRLLAWALSLDPR